MKEFFESRVLPCICAFSILVSFCVVPSHAVFDSSFSDLGSVSEWESKINNPATNVINAVGSVFGVDCTATSTFWALVDRAVSPYVGSVSLAQLCDLCASFDSVFDRPMGQNIFSQLFLGTADVYSNSIAALYLGKMNLDFEVQQHPASGFYRIKETTTNTWVVTSSGAYPYDWGKVVLRRQSTESPYYVYLSILPLSDGTPLDIAAIEVTAGESSSLSAEFISSITLLDKEDLNTPSLAVRTDLEITNYQIGGVRPSVPTKGLVWAMVENERITSIQIYNGQAWEACDGRIWTGERWIPASSYNIITLQDMYDIVDATQNYEYIYSESGFWSWWQKSWNAFTEKLFSVLGSGGGSGSTSIAPSSVKEAVSNALSSLIEGIFGVITEVLKALIGAATDLISGIFGFLSDTVLSGLKAFFGIFTDGSLLEGFQQTGEDGSTTIGLPEGVPTVFAFFSGFFMLLPAELRMVLFFGMGLLFLLAVFKIVRE